MVPQKPIPQRCLQYPYNCTLCFQNITRIHNYHSPWALFYKQLATASPSTHLDIKKLQKRGATLLKNRACFQNTTASAGAPIFYIVQSPKKRRSRKKNFSFFANKEKKVMTHVIFTKYICFLIKKPLHLFINQWESRTNALPGLLKPISVSKIQRHDKKLVKHPELQRNEKGALNCTRRTYL